MNRGAAFIVGIVLALALAGCGSSDGGGRGTGLSAVVSGNIANTGVDGAAEPGCPFINGEAVVRVRGTENATPVEADCTFELRDVQPGDVTVDIQTEARTNSVTVNNVPGSTVVVLVDVRLGVDSTEVAAIEVRPSEPAPPRRFAIIAEPPSGDAPLAVQFSFAPEGLEGTTVQWNFGDRSRGSIDLAPEHTYAAPGDYVVALTVAEPSRQTHTFYLVVRATEPPVEEPLSVRLTARPQSGPPPLIVHFQANVFGGRPAAKVVWNFGDRSPLLTTDQTVVEHEYPRSGSFIAIVTVTDDLGREAGASFPIVVERRGAIQR